MNAGCTNYHLLGSADTCIHLGSGVAVLCLVSSEFKVYRLMISVQNFCNGYWQPKGHRYKYFWKMPVIMWPQSPQSMFEFDERRRAHICWRILIFRFFHAIEPGATASRIISLNQRQWDRSPLCAPPLEFVCVLCLYFDRYYSEFLDWLPSHYPPPPIDSSILHFMYDNSNRELFSDHLGDLHKLLF